MTLQEQLNDAVATVVRANGYLRAALQREKALLAKIEALRAEGGTRRCIRAYDESLDLPYFEYSDPKP